MAYRDRLAENAGTSLAMAGAVLAVGAALGAVGLSEAEGLESPFGNAWVSLGVLLIVGSAAWCMWTFYVAMQSTRKTHAFTEQIGTAIAEGKTYRFGDGSEEMRRDIDLWARRCRRLLDAGLGEGEARAFIYQAHEDRIQGVASNAVEWGLPALIEVLHRPNLRTRLSFDHERDWMGGPGPVPATDADPSKA